MNILTHHIKNITGFRYNNLEKFAIFVAFIHARFENKLLDIAEKIVGVKIQWLIQIGYFVCCKRHHLAQHIPVMYMLRIEVGFIENINARKWNTRIINNGFGKCYKSGYIHSVVGCKRCEFGGSFQYRPSWSLYWCRLLDLWQPKIILLNNKPIPFDLFPFDNRWIKIIQIVDNCGYILIHLLYTYNIMGITRRFLRCKMTRREIGHILRIGYGSIAPLPL